MTSFTSGLICEVIMLSSNTVKSVLGLIEPLAETTRANDWPEPPALLILTDH